MIDESQILHLAAAYAFGIAGNHPFMDANRRTAWGSSVLFLKANGVALRVAAPAVVDRMVRLARGDLDEHAFADWPRAPP